MFHDVKIDTSLLMETYTILLSKRLKIKNLLGFKACPSSTVCKDT